MANETTPAVESPGREAWLKAALKTLKGAPIESLAGHTADGLDIDPLYDAAPELGRVRADAGWDIRASISAADPAKANALAHEALGGGATSLLMDVRALASTADMDQALDGVVLEAAPVALDAGLHGPLAAEWLAGAAKGAPTVKLALHQDPLGTFAAAGESPGPIEAHVARAAEVDARMSQPASARTRPSSGAAS